METWEETKARLSKMGIKTKTDPVINQPRYNDMIAEDIIPMELYNIHKRSLPVGTDVPVFFNVTKDVAKTLLSKFLLTKIKPDGTVIYYDLIPIYGTKEEKNVYWNPEEFIKGELK